MSSAPRIVLVTGTDTGVGKTYVTAALVRWLRARGVGAIAVKPVETGWNEATSDARTLAEVSGRSLEQTLWRHFELPAAPAVAAAVEGAALDRRELIEWARAAAAGSEVCLVEGAGGWLVPFAEDWLFRDLAPDLTSAVLAIGRASLGTINHSLLTIDAIARRARLIALVLSRLPEVDPQVAHSNREQIRRRSMAPVHVVPGELDELGTLFHVELTRPGT